MRNLHFMVVNDRSKVVSRKKVGFQQDGIRGKRCMRVSQIAKDDVRCRRSWWTRRILNFFKKSMRILKAKEISNSTYTEPHSMLFASLYFPGDFFLSQMQTSSVIRRAGTRTCQFLFHFCQCIRRAEATVCMTRLKDLFNS